MDKTKIKLLDNYQLMEIIRNKTIDSQLKTIAEIEFNSRNLSEKELSRINSKFNKTREDLINLPDKPKWDPIYSPFLMKSHFNQIARLKAAGKTKEAKEYQLKLNFGIFIYGLISLAFIGWFTTL